MACYENASTIITYKVLIWFSFFYPHFRVLVWTCFKLFHNEIFYFFVRNFVFFLEIVVKKKFFKYLSGVNVCDVIHDVQLKIVRASTVTGRTWNTRSSGIATTTKYSGIIGRKGCDWFPSAAPEQCKWYFRYRDDWVSSTPGLRPWCLW